MPALKSCYTQAKNLEELYPRIKEVIELCLLYCVLNENYTFGIGVRNYLRTPNGHHKSVSLKRNAV